MTLSRKKVFWAGLVTVVLIIAAAGYFVGAQFFRNAGGKTDSPTNDEIIIVLGGDVFQVMKIGDVTIKSRFIYDRETDIVTIEAIGIFPDGNVINDEVRFVGLYDDNGERRCGDVIQNFGWVHDLIFDSIDTTNINIPILIEGTVTPIP